MADKVLVTGASGFIAQHVILQLLEKGHDVRGTLRSLKRAEEVRAILGKHSPRGGSIELVEANLESDAGWAEAVAGCAFVQHVASPIPAAMPKDENELIRPARDGALRVLKASKAAGVRRVVMTSSMAAIAYGHGAKRPPVSDETMWSDPKGADNTAYTRSKTIAERAAWDYVNGEGKGLELATINPSAVLGPALSKDASPSLEIVLQLLSGKLPGMPRLGFSVVDVRDVAACHVAAMTIPAAAGERFISSDRFVWMKDCAGMLREAFPQKAKAIPTRGVPDWVVHVMAMLRPIYKQTLTELGRTRNVSNAKAQRVLGVTFRPAEEAVVAAGRSALDLGMV